MANHPSALKRIRQAEKRRLTNMSFRSRVKSTIKKYLDAVDTKKADDANRLLSEATSLLHKAVSKGVYHKNTASRTIAKLSVKLPAAQAS
jgi:small subunit ribosomal protein S20